MQADRPKLIPAPGPKGPGLHEIVGSAVSFAVHTTIAAVMLWPAPRAVTRTPSRSATSGAPKVEVFVVAQPEHGAAPGLKAFAAGQDAWDFIFDTGSTALPLPDFTFDYAKVADRGTLLFPFITPGLSLDAFGLMPRDPSRRLSYPSAIPGDGDRALPPLALTETRLQAIVDKSWSRRDRWSVFDEVRSLAEAHDPQEGALARLFQRYVQQNALQPYAESVMRDPRLWAQLGLAADHVAFIEFISRYTAAHPSTRATTELLFLLDKLVQASYDCLITLLDIQPGADLHWTARQSKDAYRLIEALHAHYSSQLEAKGIDSPAALRTYYDKVRLAILTALLHTTPNGYRSGDARYLIGAIYWRHGDHAAALDVWRGIVADPDDAYAVAYTQTLTAIHGETAEPLRRRIDRTLDAELGRWRDFSYTRLRHFGYSFATY
jgi:hypothetical protein